MWVCNLCDHELMNGGSMSEDTAEIADRRAEEDYEEDPINNECPWGDA